MKLAFRSLLSVSVVSGKCCSDFAADGKLFHFAERIGVDQLVIHCIGEELLGDCTPLSRRVIA